ncbi:MAG: DUF2071 domain-containing protein [Planctomycetaceae bacterium]|nr:DUF2071 domain-containing protein [Planctomycetaceae bacterium]
MPVPPTNSQRLAARDRPRPNQQQWMHQSWRDLLFLHWRVAPELIQRTLPPGLTVDTFDGAAWIGIVPFQMRNIRPVWCPPIPPFSNFLELNVRTYVYDAHGRAGVWFYSLDANCWPAVIGARCTYHLPYHRATMRFARDRSNGQITYTSYRRRTPASTATAFKYTPHGPLGVAHDPGTLEFFLIERYFLFAFRKDTLYSGQVHHPPYEVCAADITSWDANMLALDKLPVPDRPADHVAWSPGVDVRVYGLHRVG